MIVYEGGNGGLPQIVPICQHANLPDNEKLLHSDEESIPEDSSKHFHFGYDADTSNSSIDYNLSTDDTSSDSHGRYFSDHFVQKMNNALNDPFVPISEETVFLNSPPVNSIISSSPASIDSWTLYSNSNSMSSSDEYSLSDHLNSSSSSNDGPSTIEMHSRKKKCKSSKFESDEYVSLDSAPCTSHLPSEVSRSPSGHVSHLPRANVLHGHESVDVRIIDFAHASFVKKSDDCSKTAHQGPDGGFLTGLDSLKRLLFQITQTDI